MYERSADVYDLIYANKDYAGEAAWVRDAVRARCPEARTLLDVACGTGRHLEHLRLDFDCEGLDVTPRFVAIAAARTGVAVHLGDMDDFDLGERFDAVICLFSSIGYSRDLNAAVSSMARGLAPGGVLVIEPWFTPTDWRAGQVYVADQEAAGTRVIRMGHSDLEGNVSILEMHHLVGTAAGIEHFVEIHRMTLFTDGEYEAALHAAGLSFEHDQAGPVGRGAYIGRRAR